MKLLWKKSTLEIELALVGARTLGKTKSDESYAAFEHSQAKCPIILMLSLAKKGLLLLTELISAEEVALFDM